jgi:putative ABC transport system substrate-binding protein
MQNPIEQHASKCEAGSKTLVTGEKRTSEVPTLRRGHRSQGRTCRFPDNPNRDRLSPDQPGRSRMRRREFIAGLGCAAAWPVVARAQPGDRVRRIGVIGGDENFSAFSQALADLGWTDGRNMRIDLRLGGGDINRIPAIVEELVGLQPDVIVTNATPPTVAVQKATRTIPIVFATVSDPVASGFVARLDHPGGNITGFANLEASMGGKWLELLSEIVPGLK